MQNEVFTLLERFADLPISELSYEDDQFSLVLRKENHNITPSYTPTLIVEPQEERSKEVVAPVKEERSAGATTVKAPVVGIFYSKPSPESKAFVQLGDHVHAGDVICVLEAMKVFNEVKAPCDGKIVHIAKQDGDLVAFDDVLFEIESL